MNSKGDHFAGVLVGLTLGNLLNVPIAAGHFVLDLLFGLPHEKLPGVVDGQGCKVLQHLRLLALHGLHLGSLFLQLLLLGRLPLLSLVQVIRAPLQVLLPVDQPPLLALQL